MDGCGRLAQKRSMPRTAGHAKAPAGVKALVEHCARQGVKYLPLLAFKPVNWHRPADEASTHMGLFVQYLEKEMKSLADAGVQLRGIGDVAGLGVELERYIHAAEHATQHNQLITLCIAAKYGGCWDIVQVVKNWQIADPQQRVAELTEAALAKHLSTADMPEVDLRICTGGEQRIRNFCSGKVRC
jgi:undecaprenyl diphosphate synthase